MIWGKILVEVAGIEPASVKTQRKVTTCLALCLA